jgi:hypothetical protein
MVLFLFFPWEFPADFFHAEVDLVHQGAEQHGVNFTAKRVKKATLGMRLVVKFHEQKHHDSTPKSP